MWQQLHKIWFHRCRGYQWSKFLVCGVLKEASKQGYEAVKAISALGACRLFWQKIGTTIAARGKWLSLGQPGTSAKDCDCYENCCMKASYLVANHIAKRKEAVWHWEAVYVFSSKGHLPGIFWQSSSCKMDTFSLTTQLQGRVDEMADDVERQLLWQT